MYSFCNWAVNESDINLASASNAVIIAFNVKADSGARKLADNLEVDMRNYSIIYEAVDEVKSALGGLLAPNKKRIFLDLLKLEKYIKHLKLEILLDVLF